jgi:hypothetical protein
MSTVDFQEFVALFIAPLVMLALAMTISIVLVLAIITIARLVNEA